MYFGHQSFIGCVFCKYFLLICHSSFDFLNHIFGRGDILIFELKKSYLCFFVSCLRIFYLTKGHKDFSLMLSFRIFVVLGFILRFMILFKLIFVCSAN